MTDPKTNLTRDDAIAIKVRVETAIYATGEALKVVTSADGSNFAGRTMYDRLREALSVLRSAEAHCNRIILGNPVREAEELPPAIKLEIDGAIRRGKVFGDFLDSMLSPKVK